MSRVKWKENIHSIDFSSFQGVPLTWSGHVEFYPDLSVTIAIGSFTRPVGANRQGRFHRTLGCLDQSRRTPRIQAETQGGRRVRDNHGIGLRWAPIQSHQPIWQELKVSAVMCQPHWAQSYNEDTKARSGVPASLVFTTVTHGHSNCTFENISWKPFRKELHRWRGRWGGDRDGEYM